jgi:alpha-L-arabinofuranosidase
MIRYHDSEGAHHGEKVFSSTTGMRRQLTPSLKRLVYCVVPVPGGWAVDKVVWRKGQGKANTRLPELYPVEQDAERAARKLGKG